MRVLGQMASSLLWFSPVCVGGSQPCHARNSNFAKRAEPGYGNGQRKEWLLHTGHLCGVIVNHWRKLTQGDSTLVSEKAWLLVVSLALLAKDVGLGSQPSCHWANTAPGPGQVTVGKCRAEAGSGDSESSDRLGGSLWYWDPQAVRPQAQSL